MQFTEEKLGKAERTELDPHLVMLEQKTDNCKVKKKWLIDWLTDWQRWINIYDLVMLE